MKTKTCLRCGYDMTGHPWHICPNCGKLFAFYTTGQVAALLIGSLVGSIVLCAALVVLLWRFA